MFTLGIDKQNILLLQPILLLPVGNVTGSFRDIEQLDFSMLMTRLLGSGQ